MPHEWKDFVSVEDLEKIKNDPLFQAYDAGFSKAKELFTKKSGLWAITSPIDQFLWWKDEQEKRNS